MDNYESILKLLDPFELPGGRRLPSRILPGPMEGIMTEDYCRAMMEFGLVPAWITPFIRISHGVPRHSSLEEKLARFRPLPMIAQVMGTSEKHLAAAAGRLSRIEGVVGIELNCACPSPTVVRSGAGSACLLRPDWIRDTLSAMREASAPAGIGVKVRSGFEDPGEMPRILEAVKTAAPDWFTFHYRTAKEMYDSTPDRLERFKAARKLLPEIFMFASGDMFGCRETLESVLVTGADGITPARGLMRNPWLIKDLEAACRGENPPSRAPLPFLLRLIELAEAKPAWHDGLILEVARNAWGVDSEQFRSLAKAQSPSEMRRALL